MAKLLFSERMGLVTAPDQLSLTELSKSVRVALWSLLYASLARSSHMHSHLANPSLRLLKDMYQEVFDIPVDEISQQVEWTVKFLKPLVLEGKYNTVLDVFTYLLRHYLISDQFVKRATDIFEDNSAPYRWNLQNRYFVPVSGPEQALAMKSAFEKVESVRYAGASEHLKAASAFLTQRNFASSVRESVHAVESIACVVTGKEKATLSDVLRKLQDAQVRIHPSLKNGLEKIYSYSSDERGIRHSLIEDEAVVDEPDALFMFGACASFCSYLISKAALETRS